MGGDRESEGTQPVGRPFMADMIIDAIHTNEVEFNNQETLSLWTGLISRLVECENSYLQKLCCFSSFWYTKHTEIFPTLELL